ncbi:hypothetical protein E2C01_032569 [Portunus trituberculatus]|uniref:Uncharacterized protein n=1 Tax=Portunus trituberculatus TaxID=210409 RepID=A0A5B7EVL7_PORTR|nr:hypothetical protein [Portunus trituberculatus]
MLPALLPQDRDQVKAVLRTHAQGLSACQSPAVSTHLNNKPNTPAMIAWLPRVGYLLSRYFNGPTKGKSRFSFRSLLNEAPTPDTKRTQPEFSNAPIKKLHKIVVGVKAEQTCRSFEFTCGMGDRAGQGMMCGRNKARGSRAWCGGNVRAAAWCDDNALCPPTVYLAGGWVWLRVSG